MNQAVANQLGGHVTLTYEVVPHDPESEVRRFVRRCRRQVGHFHWILVTEEGKMGGRLHHHLLVSDELNDEVIHKEWGARGITKVVRVFDAEGIRTKAFYLAKNFDRLDRPTKHRYSASRGMGLRREVRYVLTVDGVAEALSEFVGVSGSDVIVRGGEDALRAGLVIWNPYAEPTSTPSCAGVDTASLIRHLNRVAPTRRGNQRPLAAIAGSLS